MFGFKKSTILIIFLCCENVQVVGNGQRLLIFLLEKTRIYDERNQKVSLYSSWHPQRGLQYSKMFLTKIILAPEPWTGASCGYQIISALPAPAPQHWFEDCAKIRNG